MKNDFLNSIPKNYSFTRKRLDKAFSLVQNPVDWRGAINAVIQRKDLKLTKEAIRYSTATNVIEINAYDPNFVRVVSVGYKSGPAGEKVLTK